LSLLSSHQFREEREGGGGPYPPLVEIEVNRGEGRAMPSWRQNRGWWRGNDPFWRGFSEGPFLLLASIDDFEGNRGWRRVIRPPHVDFVEKKRERNEERPRETLPVASPPRCVEKKRNEKEMLWGTPCTPRPLVVVAVDGFFVSSPNEPKSEAIKITAKAATYSVTLNLKNSVIRTSPINRTRNM